MASLGDPHEIIGRVKNAMLCMQRASWEQGTAAQALLELHDAFPDKYGPEGYICLAHDSIVRQEADGRLGVRLNRGDPGATDAVSPVPAILRAFKETHDPIYEDAAKKAVHFILHTAPRTADGIVSHRTDGITLWVDAIYMAPPTLAEAGLAWGDPSLIDEAVKQIRGYVDGLWDTERHLFSHINNVGTGVFERRAFWGVGNGWAVAGMARVYALLPPTSPHRPYLLTHLHLTLAALLAHALPSHLFHDVLDDPATFVDTNTAQQVAYAIFRLAALGEAREGWVERAEEMRGAAWGMVDRWGFVTGVCGSPTFDKSGVATEGQAFFLLMEAAYQQLHKSK